MHKKILIMLLVCMLLISSSVFADGTNIEDANTIGLNLFHNNNSKGSAVLPLKEHWNTLVGKSHGQPLVIDDMAYILTDSKLVVINMVEGKIVDEVSIENSNIESTPYIEKESSSKHNIYIPLLKGVMKVESQKNAQGVFSLTKKWVNNNDIIATNISMLNDTNEGLGRNYLVLSSKNSKIYILNSNNGSLVTNGIIESDGTLGMGLPFGDFTSIIIPANNETYERGYFASVSIVNGVAQLSYLHNDKMSFDIDVLGLGETATYTKFKDIHTEKITDLIFAVEKTGSIIGYEPFKDEVLFKVDKFDGVGDVSGLAVVDKYLLVTYKNGKLVCIDYERAIYDAQYHPNKIASTIIFETSLGDYTFSNPLIVKDNHGNDVLIVSNSKGLIKAYRLDRYKADSKAPIEYENAFLKGNKGYTSLNVFDGVISKLTFANNQLLFIDGVGKLHSYSGDAINNLAIVNFKNSAAGALEKGKTYKATLEILNSTNKEIKDVTLELIVDKNNAFNNKINVPSDGLKVEVEYTLPSDFKGETLSIVSKINMKDRVLDEVGYEDNTKEILANVTGNIDLEVISVSYKEYPLGRWAYAKVNVRNNTNQVIRNVPLKATIGGNSKVESINLSPKMETSVLYLFKTPSASKEFTIIGEVNHNKSYKEVNYDNNKVTIIANSKENVTLDSTGSRVTWSEDRADSEGKVFKKNFWAELELKAEANPNQIPSGNGFGLVVSSTVKTNYDKPNLVSGAQFGYAEFMGKRYDMIGGGVDKEQSFMLKENPESILYDSVETRHLTRKIYVPVNLADGSYDVKVVVQDAATPVGAMKKEIIIPILIDKSMYDYDYTKPGK